MTLSETLSWRGFVNQTTLDDPALLDKEPLTFYFGVDPSAASMTIGNLAAAMMVRHFIAYGHKAILLVGGATGMIGDPDGKAEERQLKPLEEIVKNKAAITEQYRQIFSGQQFIAVDNHNWFKDINYLTFLREVGKHLSMTQLLDRDFVQARIGQGGKGISYAEFSYSLIQGYDFLHLFRTYGTRLQLAGADQWGNSLAGVELIRKLEGQEAHVWTAPLILNLATGKKFGKSEQGAIWLNPAMTSVFDFYQFWLNTDDAGVATYLKIYTLLPKDQIEQLLAASKANPAARLAQKTLAYEVTTIVHGHQQAEDAKQATESLFSGQASAAMPVMTIKEGEHDIISLVVKAGLATSNSQAQRLLEQGGIKLNRRKLTQNRTTIKAGDVLQVGKRRFMQLITTD